ncbi:hypothetical protein ACYATP_08620 [Lactobacillaceae bacterium Melli_B4]
MAELGVTSTLNISNKFSWSKAKNHAKHDPNVNHSNKDIQPEYTHYNSSGKLIDYDELMESRYHDKVMIHDEKALKNHNRKGVYGSVENYLKDKKIPPYRTMVMTFSDINLKKNFVDLENGDELFLPIFNRALVDYVNGFNERNSQLKITEYVTNVDEKGAPHVHAQVVPVSLTKKGAPSASFDNALKKQFGINDGRQAMKMLRAQEDSAMVSSMNFAFDDENLFYLKRNNQKESKEMEIFKEEAKLKSLKSESKKIKSAFGKEIEKGIYDSYVNLKKSGFYQSESMTDELIPKLATGKKSFDPIDDSVHDGAGDNKKTFSGIGLINKFNNIYLESLERFKKAQEKFKSQLEDIQKNLVDKIKAEYELKAQWVRNKEKSLTRFERSLNNRESNMNQAEQKALEEIENQNHLKNYYSHEPQKTPISDDFDKTMNDKVDDARKSVKKAKNAQKSESFRIVNGKLVMSKDAFSNNNQNQGWGNQPPRNPRLFGR